MDPDALTLSAAAEDYRVKLEVVHFGGSPEEVAAKDKAREVLCEMLARVAVRGNEGGRGDLVVLRSTGLLLNKQPETWTTPGVLTGLIVVEGAVPTEALVSFDSLSFALVYLIEWGIENSDGEIEWIDKVNTSKSKNNKIKGLPSSQRVAFRACGMNGRGTGEYSEIVWFKTR